MTINLSENGKSRDSDSVDIDILFNHQHRVKSKDCGNKAVCDVEKETKE